MKEDQTPDERAVIIFLAYLSNELLKGVYYKKQEESILCIQRFYREYKLLQHLQTIHDCGVTLQSWYRTMAARSSFLRQQVAVTLLQRAQRSYVAQMMLSNARYSAVTIQSAFRRDRKSVV